MSSRRGMIPRRQIAIIVFSSLTYYYVWTDFSAASGALNEYTISVAAVLFSQAELTIEPQAADTLGELCCDVVHSACCASIDS
eukprot:scaffold273243_cov33-Prasinocladus_malaysianus.AAC.1